MIDWVCVSIVTAELSGITEVVCDGISFTGIWNLNETLNYSVGDSTRVIVIGLIDLICDGFEILGSLYFGPYNLDGTILALTSVSTAF